MENLPLYIGLVFALTTAITIYIFYRASGNSKTTLWVLLAWVAVQSVISLTGFYTVTNTLPPRFLLAIGLPIFFIVLLFATSSGRRYIRSFNTRTLTILHIIRIPIEIVLLWLFVHKAIPGIMTFEGRNFDILSGLSAPLVYFFIYRKENYNRRLLLAWNFICLGLLINIVVIAILAAPFPFQRLAFDQPNIGVLYFPFIWLPSCVVPLVLFSHLVSIRQLLQEKKKVTPAVPAQLTKPSWE